MLAEQTGICHIEHRLHVGIAYKRWELSSKQDMYGLDYMWVID